MVKRFYFPLCYNNSLVKITIPSKNLFRLFNMCLKKGADALILTTYRLGCGAFRGCLLDTLLNPGQRLLQGIVRFAQPLGVTLLHRRLRRSLVSGHTVKLPTTKKTTTTTTTGAPALLYGVGLHFLGTIILGPLTTLHTGHTTLEEGGLEFSDTFRFLLCRDLQG